MAQKKSHMLQYMLEKSGARRQLFIPDLTFYRIIIILSVVESFKSPTNNSKHFILNYLLSSGGNTVFIVIKVFYLALLDFILLFVMVWRVFPKRILVTDLMSVITTLRTSDRPEPFQNTMPEMNTWSTPRQHLRSVGVNRILAKY